MALVEVNPAGVCDHENVPVPEAVKVVLVPLQITVSPVIVTVGLAFTDTDVVAKAVHPLSELTNTLNVPVLVALALVIVKVAPILVNPPGAVHR